jgi:hypothetical protein
MRGVGAVVVGSIDESKVETEAIALERITARSMTLSGSRILPDHFTR